jgi:hypothetical protein
MTLQDNAGQMFSFAVWKTGLIVDDYRSGLSVLELEPRDRIDARVPVHHTPGLNDALVHDELHAYPRSA